MTFPPEEHTCTPREDQILVLMEGGDWDEIQEMRDASSYEDAEQLETDYLNAHGHYQANHEPSEEEREANTQAQVEEENAAAEAAE